MTEWALPVERLTEYERLVHEMENDPRWPGLRGFVRGGFWRNFKVKYPESRRDVLADDARQPPDRAHRSRRPRRAAGRATARGRADRTLPRPVQLRLLARRVRRDLPSPPPQRRLRPPDRRRQPAGPARAPAGALDRGRGRRFRFRRPAGDPPGQRQARRHGRPQPRRPTLRVGRSRDPPQPAGHSRPPAGSLSRQGPGRRGRRPRRRRQHPRSRRLQAGGPRPDAPVRRPSAQEPLGPVPRRRGVARGHRLGRSGPARRFRRRPVRRPGAAQPRPHPGSAFARGPGLRQARCGSPRA